MKKVAYSFDDLYDSFITSIQKQIDNQKAPVYKTLRGRDVEVKEINRNDSIIARAKNSVASNSAPLTKENLQKLYDRFKTIDEIKDLQLVQETVQVTPRITEFYAVFSGLKEFEKTYKPDEQLMIESKDVAKIENLSRNITEIINLGIEFTSSKPSYFYTKLAEVKQEMIANATKDAKERAEKIAENAGSDLGNLKKATMGVIQITAPNSNEDFSYGGTYNTESKEKEASITIKLEYEVD